MKLREAILMEAPLGDADARRRALKGYTDLLRAFERLGGLSGMQFHSGIYIATPNALRHPEDIAFIIREKDPTKIGGMDVNKRRLNLFLDTNEDIMKQLRSNEIRTTIIHEFIHLFDSERMEYMRPTAHLPNREYFNDPSESNAYYQEAIDRFENTMSRLSPRAREMQLGRVQRDFNEFIRLMDEMMSDDFVAWRSVKTDRKQKKRLYRYWDEIVRNL